jgi:hypothetical protein
MPKQRVRRGRARPQLGSRRRLSASALSEPVESRPPGQHGGVGVPTLGSCTRVPGCAREMRRGQATQVNFTVTAADDTDPRTTVANAAPEHLPDRGHDRELSGPWMRPAQRDGELQVTVQEAADKLADLRPCPRSRSRQGAGACARAADGEVPAIRQRTARRSRASSGRDRRAQMGELRSTDATDGSVGGR